MPDELKTYIARFADMTIDKRIRCETWVSALTPRELDIIRYGFFLGFGTLATAQAMSDEPTEPQWSLDVAKSCAQEARELATKLSEQNE